MINPCLAVVVVSLDANTPIDTVLDNGAEIIGAQIRGILASVARTNMRFFELLVRHGEDDHNAACPISDNDLHGHPQ